MFIIVNTSDGSMIKSGYCETGNHLDIMPVKGGFFMTPSGGLVMTYKGTRTGLKYSYIVSLSNNLIDGYVY